MPTRRAAPLQIQEQTAPATPAAGTVIIYAKADGKVYAKDDAGVETALTDAWTTPKFAASLGNGSATSFVVNHNLGTRDVLVTVYRNSAPYEDMLIQPERTDANNVTIRFSFAPTTNQYRVVIA